MQCHDLVPYVFLNVDEFGIHVNTFRLLITTVVFSNEPSFESNMVNFECYVLTV